LKIIFYFDGQNIHHTMKRVGVESYDFDFRGFCVDFVKNWSVTELSIKYYGAIFPREIDEYKHHRDSNFHDHLEKKQKVIVRKGKFNFDRSGKNIYPPHEKGVDVLLAVDLIVDGFHGKYDQAIIVSNDTDLIPAICEAKKTRSSGVKIHNLSTNPLHDFRQNCDNCFMIHERKLKKFNSPQEIKPSTVMLKGLEQKFKK
jgi:uncharacterized LabA/DUF88 family protein